MLVLCFSSQETPLSCGVRAIAKDTELVDGLTQAELFADKVIGKTALRIVHERMFEIARLRGGTCLPLGRTLPVGRRHQLAKIEPLVGPLTLSRTLVRGRRRQIIPRLLEMTSGSKLSVRNAGCRRWPRILRSVALASYNPQLNPSERFWKKSRRRDKHNRLFETFAELKSSLRASLRYFQTVRSKVKSILEGRPQWKTQ